jgi:long-chain acyl-CoA synthetase
VTVPLFAEDRPASIHYILQETRARFVLVEDLERWLDVEKAGNPLPEIQRVVSLHPFDPASLEECAGNPEMSRHEVVPGDSGTALAGCGDGMPPGRRMRISALAEWLPEGGKQYAANLMNPSNLATIVYTSGTTGMPKGVMLSHANILENAFACLQRITLFPEDIFLSFLPLSHTFERTVGYYVPMMAGANVTYARSIDRLFEDLLEVRPTVLISVPRIYERVHMKIEAGLKNKSVFERALFRLSVHTGWQRFCYHQGRQGWNPLFLIWPILKEMVARRLMSAFGGRVRLSFSGGAPIAPPIARVFIGLGLNLLQGYGLTETGPVISVNLAATNDPVTVGMPLPGVETLIAPNGELLVRGPSVMMGYWQNRAATQAAIDGNGYFHTGDAVVKDGNGRLRIVGRMKDIIVLSTGEKIPPADLELAITTNPLFDNVMIVGEGRPYLGALVVLNGPEWERLAADRGLPADRPDILSSGSVERILLAEIARMMIRFPGYAQVRRIHASLNPWRMRDGLVTNTLKLRRKQLLEKFKLEVDSLYQGH